MGCVQDIGKFRGDKQILGEIPSFFINQILNKREKNFFTPPPPPPLKKNLNPPLNGIFTLS